MSALGAKLVRDLTGADPAPLGGLVDQLAELTRRYPSERRMAAALGIHRKTLYRWKHPRDNPRAKGPKASSVNRIAMLAREARLSPGRPTDASITVSVVDRGPDRNSGRPRTLNARQLRIRAGTMARAADAYVRTGDPEAVAAVFLAGVGDQFYRRWLAPPSSDRHNVPAATPSGEPTPESEAGGDEGDDDFGPEDVEEGDVEDIGDPDAVDEFFDLAYEDFPEMDEGYGGDVTG